MRTTVLLFALALLLPSLAGAQSWAPLIGREVDDVALRGVPDGLKGKVRPGLALTPRSKLVVGKDREVLRPDLVDADRRRVTLYLARHGYPDASVAVQVNETGRRARVTFAVTPGPRVMIGSVAIEGASEELRAELRPAVATVRTGAPFVDSTVQGGRNALNNALRDAGYARPEVEVRVGTRSNGRIDVTYRVRPGRRFRFGDFQVEGVDEDLAELARREVNVPENALYRPEVLNDARDDLRGLELFRQTNVRAAPSDSTTLKVTARLAPRAMRTLEFSVGTWSDYPIQVEAAWRHRNLFRAGRGLRVQSTYAERRQHAGVAVEWPSLLMRRSRTEWTAEFEIESEEAYRVAVWELEWGNILRLTRKTSLRAAVAYRATDLDIRTTDEELARLRSGRQLVFYTQWSLEAVDDVLDPKRGWRLVAEGSIAPDLPVTNAPYWSLRGSAVRIQPLGAGFAIAARGELGWARPLADAEELLPNDRYYAGGYNSMRGASRLGIGPADAQGRPLGGEVRLLAGAELRMPLRGIIGASLFVDAAQVWSDPDAIDTGSMPVAVGGGLVAYTPIGPVHVEMARNVAAPTIEGNTWQFAFGIGHPY